MHKDKFPKGVIVYVQEKEWVDEMIKFVVRTSVVYETWWVVEYTCVASVGHVPC